jgi:hypothetical protein
MKKSEEKIIFDQFYEKKKIAFLCKSKGNYQEREKIFF